MSQDDFLLHDSKCGHQTGVLGGVDREAFPNSPLFLIFLNIQVEMSRANKFLMCSRNVISKRLLFKIQPMVY